MWVQAKEPFFLADNHRWKPPITLIVLLSAGIGLCIGTWLPVGLFTPSSLPSSFSFFTETILGLIGASTAIFTAILVAVKNYQFAINLALSFLIVALFNVGALPIGSLTTFPLIAAVAMISLFLHVGYVYQAISITVLISPHRRKLKSSRSSRQFEPSQNLRFWSAGILN